MMMWPLLTGMVNIEKVYKAGDHSNKCKCMMGVSLKIGEHPTSVFNVYALVSGMCRADAWLEKQVVPLLLENAAKGWVAIVGGDFNSKLTVLDALNQAGAFCPVCSLVALTKAPLHMVDSFRLVHGDL